MFFMQFVAILNKQAVNPLRVTLFRDAPSFSNQSIRTEANNEDKVGLGEVEGIQRVI